MPQKRSQSYRRQTNLPGITRSPRGPMNDWTLKAPKGWQFPQKLVDQLHGKIPPIQSPRGPMQMPLAGLGQAPDIALPNQGRSDWRIPPKPGEVRPGGALQRFQPGGPMTSQRPPEPTSVIKRPPTSMGPITPRSHVLDGEVLGPGSNLSSGGWKGALKGIAKFGGKALGVLGIAEPAARVLERIAPADEYYTPADIGRAGYDMLFGSGGDTASAQELPPIEDIDHNRSDINLPSPEGMTAPRPVKKATIKPKQKKPLSIAKPPSIGLEELTELPGGDNPIPNAFGQFGPMHKVEPLPELQSEKLPDQVSLGAKNNNTALGSDALNPDTQDSGRQSARERYMDLVSNMPGKDGYEAGIWRKILGGIAGASEGWRDGAGAGLATSQAFVNEPRDRAMAEWQTQLNELEPLMEAESKEAINQERIREDARRTNLINQSITLKENNRVAIASMSIEAKRELAELEREKDYFIANKNFDLAEAKLNEIKQRYADANKINQQNANTRSAVGASQINKNNAAADKLRAEPAGPKPPANPTAVAREARNTAMFQAAQELSIPPTEFAALLTVAEDPNDPEENLRIRSARDAFNKWYEQALRAARVDPTPYIVRK